MGKNLAKGGSLPLAGKDNTVLVVGLGWKLRDERQPCEFRVTVLLVDTDNRLLREQAAKGAIVHASVGDGDCRRVEVRLDALPSSVSRVIFAVSIDDTKGCEATFEQVRHSYIRLIDSVGEFARYDLPEDASTETAMVFGDLYRVRNAWRFRALGAGYTAGLAGVLSTYGSGVHEVS